MADQRLRNILQANLRAMIDREGLSVRAWAQGKELDVRMIDRLTKGQHAVTLDKLEEIASATGLQAWQLLLPDLDPNKPPTSPMTDDERTMLQKLRRLLSE